MANPNNPDDHIDPYEYGVYTDLLPRIHRQNKRNQRIRFFKKIGSAVSSAAKNIAIGFCIAAVALGGVHLIGVHLLGFHVARAAHVLYEAAFAFGALGMGKWIYDKATSRDKLPSKVVESSAASDPKMVKSLNVDAEGGSGTGFGFTFKSFFLGIKARFNAPCLNTGASSQNMLKK